MRPEALREAVDRNYLAAFAALIPHVSSGSGEVRTFGGATAILTGLPKAFYNPVLVSGAEAAPHDVASSVAWVRSRGVPASVQLREDHRERLEPAVLGLGYEPEPWLDPGMALHPIPTPPSPPPGLRIEAVGSSSGSFDDWHAGIAYGPSFRRVYGPSLLDDRTFRLFVGYADGRPVAGAAAIITGDVVGVYAVGTAEHARRRGFGRALTWAAVRAGADAGCTVAVLLSSEMGLGVYRGMGFVEVCRYVDYEPTPDPPTEPSSTS